MKGMEGKPTSRPEAKEATIVEREELDVASGRSGGISDPEVVARNQRDQEEAAKIANGLKKMPDTRTEVIAPVVESSGEFSGQYKVFNELPDMAEKVRSLIDTTEGKGKGFGGFWGKFSGSAKEGLQVAKDGALKMFVSDNRGNTPRLEAYNRAIKAKNPELAWKFINRLGAGESYITINEEGTKIIESGTYSSGTGDVPGDKERNS